MAYLYGCATDMQREKNTKTATIQTIGTANRKGRGMSKLPTIEELQHAVKYLLYCDRTGREVVPIDREAARHLLAIAEAKHIARLAQVRHAKEESPTSLAGCFTTGDAEMAAYDAARAAGLFGEVNT